jgi:hypothetical protein
MMTIKELQAHIDRGFLAFWRERCGDIPFDPSSRIDQVISIAFASGVLVGYELCESAL